ncbi:hypothetical protein CAI21_07045 [Alkalilimnicola ehrlichii]|uniref:PilY1 beta-propeller domain-containing protein n=1 Tax=Alkalilimnicola ehrlichii TaxID=351052 RepID=A0A3E0WY41_9GAMM|nr:PilC/PilY family type IV pilus protein [Alkalilimnicola ehrlichii]RFA30350.1 hypothetical protein CAI21_07045 [Alkalilimnicola ehrlichii]RFA37924.1 hypothetical protein CAL65_08390 [Alkalilimnicola ehrlichii]
MPDEDGVLIENPNAEWDARTGILIQNPDPDDAAAASRRYGVTISHSGVINYINMFGQLTDNSHKSHDPVSELYYAALRYARGVGNVAAYSNIASYQPAEQFLDGFPAITDWDDPIAYECQSNAILGIGDVYTHVDKNLPGNTRYRHREPSMPPEVAADDWIDVIRATNKVGQLERLGNLGESNSWSGRENSAYMAGLAYIANAGDLRPDMPGRQSLSTIWIDVLENQTLEDRRRNQYYLATKYGGFRVPADFDPYGVSEPLPLELWHTNGETLYPGPNQPLSSGDVSFQRPDNYFLAGNAAAMVESFNAAFARFLEVARGSTAAVAINSQRLESDSAAFQASFDTRDWSGSLAAYRFTDEGELEDSPAWDAARWLDELNETGVNSRNILTIGQFNHSGLATAGTQFRGNLTGAPDELTTDVVAYLRGSRANEISPSNPGGRFRARGSRLGGIINSDPQFAHRADFGYGQLRHAPEFAGTDAGNAYLAFRQSDAYRERPPVVVVGANDGMLHGFDATIEGPGGGRELFAYVPRGVYEHLHELADPDYEHRYYVDATPRIADAWFSDRGEWRTIVVGATGAGGNSVFALDITHPEEVGEQQVLWEFSPDDMGYTLFQPSVVALPTGRFGVVVTSGYTGSDQRDGRIWVLDPETGQELVSIVVPNSGRLGSPLLVDLTGDRVANRLYVGDTEGNLWRFDLTANGNSLSMAPPDTLGSPGNPRPLFIARDESGQRQPITAPLTSAFNMNRQHMVFFGTGSFRELQDLSDGELQTLYGIIDTGEEIGGRGALRQQSIIYQNSLYDFDVRAVSDHALGSNDQGWYLDLAYDGVLNGERVVERAIVREDRVIFTTLIPEMDDPCAGGGQSFIMELNAFTGGRLDYTVFDLNDDGDFDQRDMVQIDGEWVVVSGVSFQGFGIISRPGIISDVGAGRNERKVVADTSGQRATIGERGSMMRGRQSWEQLR